MPGQGAIKAGRAFVELFADDTALARGLKGAQRRLRRFGTAVRGIGMQMVGLGAAVAAPLILATREFMRFGDQIAKMSRRTGVGVGALSELAFAAERSGADVGALEKGVKRMARTITDANSGLLTYQRAFDRIGLKAEDLAAMSPEDAFTAIADAIGKTEDELIRAAAAQEIFGRAGTQLLPMFEGGAEAMHKLRAEARRLGITLSKEDALAAEQLTDAMTDLKWSFKAAGRAVGAALAPTLKALAKRAAQIGVALAAWVKRNQKMIVTIAKVVAVIAGAGGLLIVIGMLATAVAALLSPIGLVVGALGAIGGLAAAFGIVKSAGKATAGEADTLAARYKELASQTYRTAAQELELVRVTKKLKDLFPELADQLDGTKDSADRLKDSFLAAGEAGRKLMWIQARRRRAEAQEKYVELTKDIAKKRAVPVYARLEDYEERLAEMVAERAELSERMLQDAEIIREYEIASGRIARPPGAVAPGTREAAGKKAKQLTEEELEAAEKRQAFEEEWIGKAHRQELENIEDEYDRARALLIDRYAEEFKEAEELGAATEVLERECADEATRLWQRFEDQRVKAVEQAAEERARIEEGTDYEIARLKIQLTKKGHAQRLELMRQEERRELEQAEELGLATAKISKKWDLRRQLAEVGVDLGAKVTTAVRGTFSAAAIWGLGMGNTFDRTARATEETAKNTGKLAENTGRMVFVRP